MNAPEIRGWDRRRVLMISGGLLLAVVIIGIAGTTLFWNLRQGRRAERLYAYGVECLKKGDPVKGYSFLKEALKRSGQRPDYLEDAARAALGAGQPLEALSLAREAWQLGRKNDTLLRIMAVGSQIQGSTLKGPQVENMLRELPSDQQTLELQGDLKLWLGQVPLALDLWQQALAKKHIPALAKKIAEGYLAQDKSKEAQALLEKQRDQHLLDAEGYLVLASVYASNYDFAKASFTAGEAIQFDPTFERASLQQAVYLAFQEKRVEAQRMLAELENRPGTPREPAVIWQGRLWQAYLLWRQNQADGLRQLQERIAQEPPSSAQKGCLQFLDGLSLKLKNDSKALDAFVKARELISKQPVIELLCAMESLQAGNAAAAIEYCQQITGIASRWPQVRLTLAQALARDQQEEAAIKVLYDMHRRNIFSPPSLALFRDLTAKAGLTEAAAASQALLNRYAGSGAEAQMNQVLYHLFQSDLGKPEEILDRLNNALPGQSRAHLDPFKALLKAGNFEGALKAGESAGIREEVRAALTGFAHLGLNQFDHAEAAFSKAANILPTPDLLLQYAMVLVRNGKLPEAKQQFEKVIQSASNQANARAGLAWIALRQNRRDEFLQQAEAAIKARPELVLPCFLKAVNQLRTGNLPEAEQLCDQLLKNQPGQRDVRQLRAAILALRGRLPEAEQDLLAVFKQSPSADIQFHLARLYMAQGKGESALDLLEKPVSGDSTATTQIRMLLRFQAMLLLKKFPDAEQLLAEMKSTMRPGPYAIAAAALEDAQGRTDAAISLLKDQLQDREAAFQWAVLLLRQGKEQAVWENLRQHALSLNQWTALANLAEKSELYPLAGRFYEQALKLNPSNAMVLNNWAWTAIQTPGFDTNAVVAASRRALNAMPGSVAILDTYSEALLRSGQWKTCVEVLDAHASIVNTNTLLLCVLGQAHDALRDRRQAIAAFEKCLAEGGSRTNWAPRLSRLQIEDRIRQLKQEVQ